MGEERRERGSKQAREYVGTNDMSSEFTVTQCFTIMSVNILRFSAVWPLDCN